MKKANILIYGEGGTGKSTSIATLFKINNPNLKVRYLMTETNAMDGMEDII
jgi:predicted GTPase